MAEYDNIMDLIRSNLSRAVNNSPYTRAKLCNMAGVSYQHLVRFLNNTRGGEIGIGILFRLAKHLNLPLSYFFGDTDINNRPIYYAGCQKLPKVWDEKIKEILALGEGNQKLVMNILTALLDTFSNR